MFCFVIDFDSGCIMVELLLWFEIIIYCELWVCVGILVIVLSVEFVIWLGDWVCVLGFNSVDYIIIDIVLIWLGVVLVLL